MICDEISVLIDKQIEEYGLPDLRGTKDDVLRATLNRYAFISVVQSMSFARPDRPSTPSWKKRVFSAIQNITRIELAPAWNSIVGIGLYVSRGRVCLSDEQVMLFREIITMEIEQPWSFVVQEALFVAPSLPYRVGEWPSWWLRKEKFHLYLNQSRFPPRRGGVRLSDALLVDWSIAHEIWQKLRAHPTENDMMFLPFEAVQQMLESRVEGLEPPFYEPNELTTFEHMYRFETAFRLENLEVPDVLAYVRAERRLDMDVRRASGARQNDR